MPKLAEGGVLKTMQKAESSQLLESAKYVDFGAKRLYPEESKERTGSHFDKLSIVRKTSKSQWDRL